MMEGSAYINCPENVEVNLILTAPLNEWIELAKYLEEKAGNSPFCELRWIILRMKKKMEYIEQNLSAHEE